MLNIVHPIEPIGETRSITVDVIAVHGLGGDWERTWTNENTGIFWLKDCLPHDVESARVMSFEYNAAFTFGGSTADVGDHAKDLLSDLIDKREQDEEASRPIIFLAHSLGGIVVKQALFQASIEPRYKKICESTVGIMFFGTPHRGSEKAAYGKILAGVANTVLNQPSSRLLNALQTNSDTLMRLTSDFRFQLPRYQVASFYEQVPMMGTRTLVVEKYPALLDIDGEEQIPINANHRNMCKFEGRNDGTYGKVFKRVRRMLKEKNKIQTDARNFRNQFYEVPRLVSSIFTGCEGVSQKLSETCLTPGTQNGPQMQKRFVLYGLGGSGKSQLSLKFAQDHRERFWGVFWIGVSSAQNAELGFMEIARRCGLGLDFDGAKSWLANLSHQWLLILDNADDITLDLSNYFPPGDRGTIIITSRNPECRMHATVGFEELGKMDLEDAITLLLKASSAQDIFDENARKSAQPVVEVLGRLALAIIQAGAVIRRLYSMEEYCTMYSRHRKQLLDYWPIQASKDYRYTVFTTWEVSLDMIRALCTDAARDAEELLHLFCFFHYDGITESILQEASKNDTGTHGLRHSYLYRLAIFERDQSELGLNLIREAIALLSSFSLVKREANGLMSIHPLVHAWGRDRMEKEEQVDCWKKANYALSTSISWRFETTDYQLRKLLVPHIDACVRFYRDIFESDKYAQTYCDEADKFALAYKEVGRAKEALQLTEEILEVRKRTLGDEHPDTLGSMNNLALRYSDVGRTQEALQLTEKVLKIMKRTLREEHPDTLVSMNNLANRYSDVGRTQKALQLTEEVLEVRKRTLREEHPDTLVSMNNLALRYSDVGRTQEALQLTEEVLEVRKRTLGDEHPKTFRSMNNLANRYSDVGRTQEALQLTEETLEVRKRTLGDEHPKTLRSTENLKILKLRLSEEAHVVSSPEKRKGIRAAFKKLFR